MNRLGVDDIMEDMTLLPNIVTEEDSPGVAVDGGVSITSDLPPTFSVFNASGIGFGLDNSTGILRPTLEPAPGPQEPLSLAEGLVFALLMSVCICATIVGNVLVILSVFKYRPLKSVQNFFIVSLSVADLAVAILVMPFNVANFVIGHWVFGAVFCNMWLTFDILTCTASILNLCAIAMDRYYAIHDPINYAQKRTLRRVLISIAVVWGASALISVPPLLGWNNSAGRNLYNEETRVCTLTDDKSFVIYSASGSFYVPLVIMSFVYLNIFLATRRRLHARAKAASAAKMASMGKANQVVLPNRDPPHDVSSTESPDECGDAYPGAVHGNPDGHGSPRHTSPNHQTATTLYVSNGRENLGSRTKLTLTATNSTNSSRGGSRKKTPVPSNPVQQFLEEKQRISLSRERRAARTMAIIMGVFVLCWLPFFLMYIIFPFCKTCAESADSRVINFIVWLGYINSCLNPIIYTIFNIDFRRAFKWLLQGKCRA